MRNRNRARGLLAGLVFITLVLITIDYRAGTDGPVQAMRRVATSVFGPAQLGVTAAVNPVAQELENAGSFFDLRAENQRLRDEIAELSTQRQSYLDLRRDRDDLRRLLAFVNGAEHNGIAATTIASSPSNFEWVITIDAGAGDGIAIDMPVVNSRGLVGKVLQVGTRSSRVLLAIDPTFFAASRESTRGEVGTTRGRGADLLRFTPIDPEGRIDVGDEIVTSTYAGGVYPAGIPIGTVEEAGPATNGLTRHLAVRPYVDFTTLDTVFVIFRNVLPPLPEPDLDSRTVAPPGGQR